MNQNNWYVITGAPCSGKTTLIELLEKRGYKVVYETARIYIDNELAKGKTIEEIRQNELEFQKKVLRMKINTEKKLSPEEIIFFDRGLPDTEAYFKLHNFKIDDFVNKAIKKSMYKKIFLLELIKHKKDYARTENQKQQKLLQLLLEKVYKKLNFPIIKVPKMIHKKERLKFILNNL